MSKVKGPLFSLSAKGTIGKSITYQKRYDSHSVYKYRKPGSKKAFTPSATQRDKRMLYNLIIARWQTMTDDERKVYDDLVKDQGLAMSGWNWFYKEALKDLPKYLGLQGYWSFNRIVNGEILDLSGNENDGSLEPTYPGDAPTLVDSLRLKFGKAGDFNGSSDYINVPTSPSLNITDEITLEAWIKPNNTADAQTILEKGKTGSTTFQGYTLTISANILYFFISDGTARDNISSAFTSIDWSHIVAIFDGDWMRLYVNGVEVDSKDTALTSITVSALALRLGMRSYAVTQWWNGLMDEVRIYNRVLPLSEIKKHYALKNR